MGLACGPADGRAAGAVAAGASPPGFPSKTQLLLESHEENLVRLSVPDAVFPGERATLHSRSFSFFLLRADRLPSGRVSTFPGCGGGGAGAGTSPDARSPLSPGMVLVRSENGQLLMIPQQALAQMQAQAHVQTQPQTTMAPRPATPTSAPPVQISTVQVSARAPGGSSPRDVLPAGVPRGRRGAATLGRLRGASCASMLGETLPGLRPVCPLPSRDSTPGASVSSSAE